MNAFFRAANLHEVVINNAIPLSISMSNNSSCQRSFVLRITDAYGAENKKRKKKKSSNAIE